MKKSVTRLYPQFQPSKYDLLLWLNPDSMTFRGSVVIAGKRTGRPSHRMTFHQKDLKITGATIRREDKKGEQIFTVDRINTHKTYDEIRLHTKEKLMSGDYVVMIEFSGKITGQMSGIYPCHFTHKGEDKKLIATQFESHHAREVFPCIDEPEAKATFNLVLDTPDSGTVLANTPAESEVTDGKGRRRTYFETTPIMSTYLLAFACGDIGYKQAATARGTLVRAFATPDNVKHTGFALETAVKCLEFYEDYFGIPYPLAKCDMIALPDFASGAMENWGLITYREQCMLVDPKNTSIATKQYVAMVVAHELAHQWFGNLVTMKWWTDLWLNEGFASWIEYLATDKLFPDWQMWTQFTASEQQPALKLDALDNTHAIEVPIRHPDEIRTIFDAISYSKGASVIHMLHGYLGAGDFRDGLRYYLKSHAYGNTNTVDLWAALEHVSKKPVREFMHAWTSQPGFPLVSVLPNPAAGLKPSHASKASGLESENRQPQTTISQERFYMQKPAKISQTRWPIPLLAHLEGPEALSTPQAVYQTALNTKLNGGQSGFYRTLYAPGLLASMASNLEKLDPLDRLGILADAFECAKAGYSSITGALTILAGMADEDNAAVWDIIAAAVGETRRIMDDDRVREGIKPLVSRLTAKQWARLGWDGKKTDSHFDKLLRPAVLGLATSADDKAAVNEALKRFKAAKSSEDIAADLRGVVFTAAARRGGEATFNKLLRFHEATASSEERTTLAAALTAFEQPALIKKALSLITTKTVRRQDAMYWVAYSFMNRHARAATWQWMQEHWAWLDKELGSDLSFYRTPIYAARSFSDKAFAKEYDDFFNPKMSPALERSIRQGREILDSNIAWKQRDLGAVLKFLA